MSQCHYLSESYLSEQWRRWVYGKEDRKVKWRYSCVSKCNLSTLEPFRSTVDVHRMSGEITYMQEHEPNILIFPWEFEETHQEMLLTCKWVFWGYMRNMSTQTVRNWLLQYGFYRSRVLVCASLTVRHNRTRRSWENENSTCGSPERHLHWLLLMWAEDRQNRRIERTRNNHNFMY